MGVMLDRAATEFFWQVISNERETDIKRCLICCDTFKKTHSPALFTDWHVVSGVTNISQIWHVGYVIQTFHISSVKPFRRSIYFNVLVKRPLWHRLAVFFINYVWWRTWWRMRSLLGRNMGSYYVWPHKSREDRKVIATHPPPTRTGVGISKYSLPN